MKILTMFVCFVLFLNLFSNTSCENSKYYSTFGDFYIDNSQSGLEIKDYVTLKNDIKSSFTEGRF